MYVCMYACMYVCMYVVCDCVELKEVFHHEPRAQKFVLERETRQGQKNGCLPTVFKGLSDYHRKARIQELLNCFERMKSKTLFCLICH